MKIKKGTAFQMPERTKLKTYSHLSDQKRIPNDYIITSSQMLYYPSLGNFEVKTPIAQWYQQYQHHSQIKAPKWSDFNDPKLTTYEAYVTQQYHHEIYIEEHLKHIEDTGFDQQLSPLWVERLSQVLGPIRFPWHGMQMVASYLGSMAPESKLVIVFSYQTMNEMKRIQRVAYRIRQLQLIDSNFAETALPAWQSNKEWQPLRQCIEQLLVTYDWLESFIALNICIKPLFDQLFLIHFSQQAKNEGDHLLALLFHSLWEDALWQQSFSHQLLTLILDENQDNQFTIQTWIHTWVSKILPAVQALEPLFLTDFQAIYQQLVQSYKSQLQLFQLKVE